MICKIRYIKTKKGSLRVNFKCRSIIGTKIFIYPNDSMFLRNSHLDIIKYIKENGSTPKNLNKCKSDLKNIFSLCIKSIKTSFIFDLNTKDSKYCETNVDMSGLVRHANTLLDDDSDVDEDDEMFYDCMRDEFRCFNNGRTPPLTGCR